MVTRLLNHSRRCSLLSHRWPSPQYISIKSLFFELVANLLAYFLHCWSNENVRAKRHCLPVQRQKGLYASPNFPRCSVAGSSSFAAIIITVSCMYCAWTVARLPALIQLHHQQGKSRRAGEVSPAAIWRSSLRVSLATGRDYRTTCQQNGGAAWPLGKKRHFGEGFPRSKTIATMKSEQERWQNRTGQTDKSRHIEKKSTKGQADAENIK